MNKCWKCGKSHEWKQDGDNRSESMQPVCDCQGHYEYLLGRVAELEAELEASDLRHGKQLAKQVRDYNDLVDRCDAAEAKLAEVADALRDYEFDQSTSSMAVGKCWDIICSHPKVLARVDIPEGYTLLSMANDKEERVAYAEVEHGGTVIVLEKEEE